MAEKIYKLDLTSTLLAMEQGETLMFKTSGPERETSMNSLRTTATKLRKEKGKKVVFRELEDNTHAIAIAL